MPFSRGSRIGPILAGAVLIVLLNSWFAVSAVRNLNQNDFWLAHTWQVIGQLERILSSAGEGESGARGYVITGNEQFLTQYYFGRDQIFNGLDQMSSLIGDNPKQATPLREMRDAITLRFQILEQDIDTRRTQGIDSAVAKVATLNGKRQMDRFRSAGFAMEDEERRLLAVREEDSHRSTVIAFVAIGVASSLDLLLLILVGRILVRERQLRLESEKAHRELGVAHERVAANNRTIQLLNADLEERVRVRTAELESTNRELEAFSYSVSHDLRAPLRTIDGFSLALQEDYEDAVDDVGRDYIRRVRAGVQRMGGLIDALLQLSRITRAELTREDVDVTALVQSVAKELQEENPQQSLHFDIQQGMRANADRELLRVAFENLMGNAVKFSSKVPVSLVRVSYNEAEKTFQVSDNGAGFDMSYSSKLFNAFNRLHGDKDFKGSGIGLATVARVIRRHHGTISAESQVGHGARFSFTLG